jgi:hypothetical protein
MPTSDTSPLAPAIDAAELFGLLAEFDDPAGVLAAARQAHRAGYRRLEAYSPFPVHGLAEALGKRPTRLPLITLLGGLLGGLGGYALQYWVSVVNYPFNVGGRPPHSWPAFLPVVFELAVLGAAVFSVLGMLALNGLPMPYHPVFNVPQFKLASRDRFFLSIQADDPQFEREATRTFLDELHPLAVHEISQ